MVAVSACKGLWVLYCFSAGERVALTSVGWEGAIADLYEDVNVIS